MPQGWGLSVWTPMSPVPFAGWSLQEADSDRVQGVGHLLRRSLGINSCGRVRREAGLGRGGSWVEMQPEDGLGQLHESSEAKMAHHSCLELAKVANHLYPRLNQALGVILFWGRHDLG